jgi:hypothetical protein
MNLNSSLQCRKKTVQCPEDLYACSCVTLNTRCWVVNDINSGHCARVIHRDATEDEEIQETTLDSKLRCPTSQRGHRKWQASARTKRGTHVTHGKLPCVCNLMAWPESVCRWSTFGHWQSSHCCTPIWQAAPSTDAVHTRHRDTLGVVLVALQFSV